MGHYAKICSLGISSNYKNDINTSPFQLVYGTDALFHVELIFQVMKCMQDIEEEPNEIQRRIFHIVKLQQEREALVEKEEAYKRKVKERFEKKVKEDTFLMDDMVLI